MKIFDLCDGRYSRPFANFLSIEDIKKCLQAIQTDSKKYINSEASPMNSIQILTSLPRNEWADLRKDLKILSMENSTNIKLIESVNFT